MVLLVALATFGAPTDAREPLWSGPRATDVSFDWIRLESGEWLKGELIALYNEELEFDSDELDDLTFDWSDIAEIRTARVVQVRFSGERIATGSIVLENDTITVLGTQTQRFDRDDVLTIVAGTGGRRATWDGKITIGATLQQGNTDQYDVNTNASFQRRTVETRAALDYRGNYTETLTVRTVSNHRINGIMDRFISDRLFWRVLESEYYRDPFQNIRYRISASTAIGYQIIDTARTDWSITAGPGYLRTQFDAVEAGENERADTPSLALRTTFDYEITRNVDFEYDYRIQLLSEDAGAYTHHMVSGLSVDFIGNVDVDLSLIWDRTENPQRGEDGQTPAKDDLRFVLGIGFDF
ncbi:MAG: DUF481 domain-containing protein [Pseudomonadales bacterium]|jgi:putative salt-induced outer membrane protein YdiY|nr:DUF481 domain-containing protein [Pseudomonadales bacterium]